MNLIYQKVDPQKYNVVTKNEKLVGELIMDVDGYFYFWPEDSTGAWTPYILRQLADKMDEINKPWDEQVENDLSTCKEL
jgi:hypothetical protein